MLRAGFQQHLDVAGAFDENVGLGGRAVDVAAVDVGRPEPADHVRLAAFGDPIEHECGVAALDGQQRG